MNIAIITARGGSKRIPHKNRKEFCGKPIIEYSIEAAKQAGIFDTVMVSTDDNKIAEIAAKLDLNVDLKINKCHSSTDTSRNDNMVTTEVPCKIIQFPNPYVKVDEELEEM